MTAVKKRMTHYLILGLGLWFLLLLFLRWREPRLLYYPLGPLDGHPGNVGLRYEDIWLTTADGVRLHSWYLPTTNPAAFTVLFLHGNAGNISHRLDKLRLLHDLGVNTLILDYRGYGRSAGQPNETGTYADALAAYRHLIETRHATPATILAFGESLGAAIAVELATTQPLAGLVIEEPFTSVAEVGQKMFPFAPVRLIVRNRYDTLAKMPRLTAPLLIFHSRVSGGPLRERRIPYPGRKGK